MKNRYLRSKIVQGVLLAAGFWVIVAVRSGWSYHACGGKYALWAGDPDATPVPAYMPGCVPAFRIAIEPLWQLIFSLAFAVLGLLILFELEQVFSSRRRSTTHAAMPPNLS